MMQKYNQPEPDRAIVMPTHMVLKPGEKIGYDVYDIILRTVDTSQETKMDRHTNQLEITGTYGFWPDLPGPGFIIKALWELIASFGGRMDVVATNRANDVAISINNPTIGYPYAVFVEWSTGRKERHNYYADESFAHTDSNGKVYAITRHEDSEECKEWTVMVNN